MSQETLHASLLNLHLLASHYAVETGVVCLSWKYASNLMGTWTSKLGYLQGQ